MEKKEIVLSKDDVEISQGKVIIDSSKLSEMAGMNLTSNEFGEEGANAVTISVTF